MKRLVLLRHGEAGPAGALGSDFARPLTPHGRAQALQAAHRLQQAHCVPESILASPALRARETAAIAAAHLERLQALRFEASAYPGTPEALLQLVGTLSERIGTLLLVGHNPGLSELACRLAALAGRQEAAPAAPPASTALSTGGLCRIELADVPWPQLESGVTHVTLLS